MKTIHLEKPKERMMAAKADEVEIPYISQVEMANKIYMGELTGNLKKTASRLHAKLNSYKTQDKKKDRFEESEFITDEQLYEKLVISKLKCNYCRKEVKLVYYYVRDGSQWTLDRLDNDIGHSSDNTVICCLKCNLQRRVTDANKFSFTKQLILNKGF
jgi:hypothetical protein